MMFSGKKRNFLFICCCIFSCSSGPGDQIFSQDKHALVFTKGYYSEVVKPGPHKKNKGIAFGIFNGAGGIDPYILTSVTVIAIFFIVYLIFTEGKKKSDYFYFPWTYFRGCNWQFNR